jgi:wyosine [tRNA(Phe)-imidazoG37] synthetase (radical SAM superfamily)
MSTFLFDELVFGPVKSRRLGVSLGINLLPVDKKICNFECIYCECGWTADGQKAAGGLPRRKEVFNALEKKLSQMKAEGTAPDVITYAGNGEPTLHPEFPAIIDDSIILRNRFFPDARIAVLSNSTTIKIPSVKAALMKVDQNILKLDSAFDSTIKKHNQPKVNISVAELIDDLASFNGHVIIQTLFLKGRHGDETIDNTTPEEIDAWLAALGKIKPSEVMIYTISRDTPEGPELGKIPASKLMEIAMLVEKLGIKAQVSG